MRVMVLYVANDTMLQWSNQLVLVAENELFNDGIALNEEGARPAGVPGTVPGFRRMLALPDVILALPPSVIESEPVVEDLVLGDQKELVGPPQHGIIAIIPSHDSNDDIRTFEQLWRQK